MTVQDLIEKLKTMTPHAIIVVPDFDHSYRQDISVCEDYAAVYKCGQMDEWFGLEHVHPDGFLSKHPVVVIT